MKAFYTIFIIIILIINQLNISGQDIELKGCSRYKTIVVNNSNTYVADPRLLYYDISFYYIDLEVNDTSTFISGFTEIYARADTTSIAELVFELSSLLTVDSVLINGIVQKSFSHLNDLVIIVPGIGINRNDNFSARIYYHGVAGLDGFFSGISNRTDYNWNQRVTYTLSESFHAKDWFACKQVLTDKADSAYIFITTDTSLMAGSNGTLSNVTLLPAGKHRYEWKSFYPVAFYLLSLAVSDYQDYSFYAHPAQTIDSILIQNYIYGNPEFLTGNKESIDATRDIIEIFSDIFGLYPFSNEKYGHCFAPIGGGMENQTMTTLSSFNFYLVAHELSHQWFGDYVTCATWQDIWINEGFASYSEYLAMENLGSGEEAKSWMVNAHDRARTEPDGSIYVPAEDATNENRIFNMAKKYKKGASILHMIRYELDNDTIFFRTLRNFQQSYKNLTAIGLDFLKVLEETSGKDFNRFFNQWYFGKGYPVFNITWWQETDSLIIDISQTGSSEGTSFFRTHLDFLIRLADGRDTLVRVEQINNEQHFNIRIPTLVFDVIADPENWILDVSTVIKKPLPEDTYRISPNPFTDRIWVEFGNSNIKREILISDLSGKVVATYETEYGFISLPVSSLVRGVYLFTVIAEGKSLTTLIVKD